MGKPKRNPPKLPKTPPNETLYLPHIIKDKSGYASVVFWELEVLKYGKSESEQGE